MGPSLKSYSEQAQFLMAVQTALTVVPSKLILAYYFINIGVKRLLSDKKDWLRLIIEVTIALSISIAIFRMSFHYFIYPYIYKMKLDMPVFSARTILISILEIGYITGIAITLKLFRIQAVSKEREKNLVKEKLQTELKFLRNQTNPHFLFNTLNNIYALTRKKSDSAPEVVMKLSELLSFMLYESGKESITIADEIKILEDYMELERIRYNERLSIEFKKEIDDPQQPIAPLLFLPLVENAFKYGVSETRFSSFIEINMILRNGNIQFRIENSIENTKAGNGRDCIGLNNFRRQMELMYSEHTIDVSSDEKTFKVFITINLKSYGKI
jgi:LytS/YehU family sensor histidine kinase